MPKFRAHTDVEDRIHQQVAWGGTPRSDREGFLSSRYLGVRRATPDGFRRWDVLLTALMGVLIFSAVVFGCAVIWPSYLACRHLQQTKGFIGGQTLNTCTIQRSLWRFGLRS